MSTTLERLVLIAALVVLAASSACSGTPDVVREGPTGIPLPPRAEVKRHEQEVTSLAVSPDAATVATVSGDSVHLWDASTMRPLVMIDDVPLIEFHNGLAVADGGNAMAVLNENLELFVWEASTLEIRPVRGPFGEAPRELVGFGRDGSLFYLTTDDRLVRWFSGAESGLETGEMADDDAAPVRDRREVVSNVSFYATSRPLGDGRYLVWNRVPFVLGVDGEGRATQEPLTSLETVYGSTRTAPWLAGTERDQLLMVQRRAVEILPVTGGVVDLLDQDGVAIDEGRRDEIVASSASPDGRYLAVGYRSGAIEVWDIDAGARSAAYTVSGRFVRDVHPRRIYDLEFSAEALHVLVPEQRLLRYETGTWTLESEVEL